MVFFIAIEITLYSLCINIFTFFTIILNYWELVVINNPVLQSEYDYIVVGSGTAGSLIAHRIATQTDHSYVILEAGLHGNLLSHIPVLGPLLQGSVHDWMYETVPQENACKAMHNNKCKWPRGKIVGGSAILNNMIHLRGNVSHYSDWFDRNVTEDDIEKQLNYVERNILHVDYIKYKTKLTNAVLNAAVELDYQIKDLNKQFDLGFMEIVVNQFHGKRWTTGSKLLSSKHNLVTGVKIEKVIIDADNVAKGVQLYSHGIINTVRAKKGVILSAGTINTPQILLLSGIGPKNHLEEAGIPLVKELPVGQNLQDHVTTGLDLILLNETLDLNPLDMVNPMNIFNYFVSGEGPLTFPGCEVTGVVSTSHTKIADLQLMVLPVGLASDRGAHLKNAIGIKDEVWREYFANLFDKKTASIIPIVMHPNSRGEVKLNIKNPTGPPIIDPKYLTSKEDIDILVKGLKFVEQIVNTESMKKLGARMNPQSFPGCNKYKLFTKEYWECYVTKMTLTTFHPVGTCKMGSARLQDSVVNRNFAVIGVKNLYVVDGSVLPHSPSGNINAAIALMANIFFEKHFVKRKMQNGEY